ncbi:chemotaxis protein CheB [Leisingera sp. SS27]|uniref:chemotaxis protein CheB n=1 Tax=Leisingera sp. SS27 TaxID=2979462 RepID=UPI00232C0911|nr:chemotaxis protein CheB [Leisingera sp. SS27]MDC0660210.1 chemotaxis protein CheB [Leisingera sp. SS27]
MNDLEQDPLAGTSVKLQQSAGSQTCAGNNSYNFACITTSPDGLASLLKLVSQLPSAANTIYVIAQQPSSPPKGDLASLIAPETTLPVVELGSETDPVPGTIYVIPEDQDVVFEGGRLLLCQHSKHPSLSKPATDPLFMHIAEECGEHCVRIVLSGTENGRK